MSGTVHLTAIMAPARSAFKRIPPLNDDSAVRRRAVNERFRQSRPFTTTWRTRQLNPKRNSTARRKRVSRPAIIDQISEMLHENVRECGPTGRCLQFVFMLESVSATQSLPNCKSVAIANHRKRQWLTNCSLQAQRRIAVAQCVQGRDYMPEIGRGLANVR